MSAARCRALPLIFMCVTGAGAQQPAAVSKVPPGFTMSRTGTKDDFAYFEGGWTTKQHRLIMAGARRGQWDDFPGTLCMTRYLDGLTTIDELYFPQSGTAGLTLRTFDPKARQWSIYWVNSTTGRLDPVPVVGGFQAGRGEFYASDHIDGRPVKVRYLWLVTDHDHARWEQAFSFNDHTWETNWTAEFTRAATTAVCVNGQPRR